MADSSTSTISIYQRDCLSSLKGNSGLTEVSSEHLQQLLLELMSRAQHLLQLFVIESFRSRTGRCLSFSLCSDWMAMETISHRLLPVSVLSRARTASLPLSSPSDTVPSHNHLCPASGSTFAQSAFHGSSSANAEACSLPRTLNSAGLASRMLIGRDKESMECTKGVIVVVTDKDRARMWGKSTVFRARCRAHPLYQLATPADNWSLSI
jgi:hypothetical protein